MTRASKTAEPLTTMDLARRLREALIDDADFAPDDVPTSRGRGIYDENVEFHAEGVGARFTVLVVRSR